MKKIIISTAVFATAMTLSAQNNLAEQAKQDLINSFTLGGCVITQGGWTDNKAKDAKVDFAARSARMHVAGKVLDYAYMLQLEYTGVAGTAKESGPHIVDAWIEWQKFPEFKVKLGQQKRAFTFENPYHPMDIGFGTYSQCVSFIGGYADIVGEQLSHGRDVGLAISGDLVPQGDHKLLHYHAGVYTGQGVNHSDKNKRKDLLAGVWAEPIKDLLLGIYGWTGDYVDNTGVEIDRNRWAASVKYEHNDWTVRAEYAHAQGILANYQGNGKADGWYATVGVPCTPWLKVYGKYDAYRADKTWGSTKTIYSIIPNIQIHKNLMMQVQYNHVHNRNLVHKDYNELWAEMYVRF